MLLRALLLPIVFQLFSFCMLLTLLLLLLLLPEEVIVIDEIGTEAECLAARTIAQRGVQLIATAHGEAAGRGWGRAGQGAGWLIGRCNCQCCTSPVIWSELPASLPAPRPPPTSHACPHLAPCAALPLPAGNELENVVKNPSLNDLVGGICSVTLGDDEAKRRGVQKSILERQVGRRWVGAGSWAAGSWAAGSWAAGSWVAGSWAAGSWQLGCRQRPAGQVAACAILVMGLPAAGWISTAFFVACCLLQSPPTFDACVEMASREQWRVHLDVGWAVDCLLLGKEAGVWLDGCWEHTGTASLSCGCGSFDPTAMPPGLHPTCSVCCHHTLPADPLLIIVCCRLGGA
jgi:hypothetical protein